MSTAPITRKQQMELMATAKERNDARAKVWKGDVLIKRMVSEPAPGQEPTAYKVMPRRKTG